MPWIDNSSKVKNVFADSRMSRLHPFIESEAVWESDNINEFSDSSLLALVENRIPAVSIKSFACAHETEALVAALQELACRTSSISQVTRLGISQYEQGIRASKANYFKLAKHIEPAFSKVYARSFSPVQRLIQQLEETGFDAGIMSEPGMGLYFAGNGKLRNGYSPVHVDFAPQDSAGWAIAETGVQLAWNLYLRVPPEGGELLLWDKHWQPEDDVHQVDGNYYYDEAVVRDARMVRLHVSPGEVIIINSRNYHAVTEARDRLAFGSFISVFEGNRLRLWS